MLAPATLLEAALHYAELGWPVMPLHTPVAGVCDCPDTYRKNVLVRHGGAACDKPGKHPRTQRGLDDASTDRVTIERWWKMWPAANIGIHLVRAGLVDIAPDSIVWQAQFVAHGLPWTPSFKSGGGDGHEHHLYVRPEVCPTYRLCRPDEYDVLSNGYAIMPPSLHVSGEQYTWMTDPDSLSLAPAPQWSVEILTEAARRNRATNGVAHLEAPAVDEAPVKLHGEALERWNGQIVSLKPGGTVDRSLSLFYIGKGLAVAGASRSAIARCLQERDETLGWSKYVGRRDAAARYAIIADKAISGRSPRLVVPRSVGAEPPVAELASEPYKFIVRDAADFVALELPKIEWLVPGLLREQGIVGNFGGPGTLKTYFATQLGIALSLGPPRVFLEFEVRRTKVLIVQEDTPESDYQQVYLRPMLKALKVDPEHLRGWLYVATSNDMLLDDQDRVATLDAWLTENHPGLLILDAFFLLHQGEGMTARDLGPVLRVLKKLRKKHQCAIWIIDHNRKQTGKGDDADPIDKWYGGRPKSAATDGAIEAHVLPGQDDVVEFKVVKMRGGQKLIPAFQVKIYDGVLHPFTSADALSESSAKVYDWLLAQPISRTIRDIQAGSQLKERSVHDAIRSLSERGWIEPGDPVGERPHQQKTWAAVHVAGLSPEQEDV